MPHTTNYYPPTIDGRGHWWGNIDDNVAELLTGIGYTTARITPIQQDATWAVYCYTTIHRFFGDVTKALAGYEDAILNGPNGGALPALPVVPALPDAPVTTILCGIEARRILWVPEVKHAPGYNVPLGVLMGIETPSTPFDRNTYICQLLGLASLSPHTVSGKFRKAGGHVDGINLYGRKTGASVWTFIGRYNATPFTAQVPLTGTAPEAWEFYAMAVKADVEFGQGSPIFPVIVRA